MRSLNNWRRVIYPLMAVLIVVVFVLVPAALLPPVAAVVLTVAGSFTGL